jgi:hypothetical protein
LAQFVPEHRCHPRSRLGLLVLLAPSIPADPVPLAILPVRSGPGCPEVRLVRWHPSVLEIPAPRRALCAFWPGGPRFAFRARRSLQSCRPGRASRALRSSCTREPAHTRLPRRTGRARGTRRPAPSLTGRRWQLSLGLLCQVALGRGVQSVGPAGSGGLRQPHGGQDSHRDRTKSSQHQSAGCLTSQCPLQLIAIEPVHQLPPLGIA